MSYQPTMNGESETVLLRRCMRNVVALTRLPSLSFGTEAEQAVDMLADVVLGLMQLDLVYVRVADGDRTIEIGRISNSPRSPMLSRAVGASLEPWLDTVGHGAVSTIDDPHGAGRLRATVRAFGTRGQRGTLVTGRRRADFPSELDDTLLEVVTTQIVVLLDRVDAERTLQSRPVRGTGSDSRAPHGDEAVRDWDPHSDTMWWNESFTRLFGYGPEVDADLGWWIARIHPDDRERVVSGIEGVVNDKDGATTHVREEYRFRRADGTWAQVVDRGHAVRDPLGKRLVRLVGSMTEIDARKRVEAEREASLQREQHRSLQLKSLAAIGTRFGAATDLDTMVQVVTDQARILVGAHSAVTSITSGTGFAHATHWTSTSEARPEALLAAEPPAAWTGSGASEAEPDLGAIFALVSSQDRPMRMSRSGPEVDGRRANRGWVAAPLVGREGQVLGLVLLSDKTDGDFTDEDEAMLFQLAQLAAVGIENARLYQRLRDDDRRKDEFLTTIAHELRNPLAPIRHALEVIRLAGDTSPRIEGVRKLMERQVRQIVRLVDDLLDVSRITRGKVELRLERMDLAEAVRSAVEASDPLVRAAGHTLTVVAPQERVYVYADLTRMAQVFSNLLNNAAKYTERGGQITLTVQVDAAWAVVRVKDSGVGIPVEMLGRVFDMFIQVDGARERAQGGLGIGLTLVRSLVSMHGGTVEAHSDGAGTGCEFVVRLPRVEPIS